MALTRMIFAIQMTDPNPTRLRVSGDVGTPAPAMTSLRRGDSEPSSVGCVDGSWTMDLDAGDYLIELQVENWVPGRLDIVTELTPGRARPPSSTTDRCREARRRAALPPGKPRPCRPSTTPRIRGPPRRPR